MITFIRIFFFILTQYGLLTSGDVAGFDYSFLAPAVPLTYDQLIFTVRGDRHQVSLACMGLPYFTGVTDILDEDEGVSKVTVAFNKLPADKLSAIIKRISISTQVINLELR